MAEPEFQYSEVGAGVDDTTAHLELIPGDYLTTGNLLRIELNLDELLRLIEDAAGAAARVARNVI